MTESQKCRIFQESATCCFSGSVSKFVFDISFARNYRHLVGCAVISIQKFHPYVGRVVELVGCLVINPPVRCPQLRWCLNVWECIVFGAAGRWSLCANWRSHWPDSHRGPSLQPTGLQDYTGPPPPPDAQRLTLPVIHDKSCHFQLGTTFASSIFLECSHEAHLRFFQMVASTLSVISVGRITTVSEKGLCLFSVKLSQDSICWRSWLR